MLLKDHYSMNCIPYRLLSNLAKHNNVTHIHIDYIDRSFDIDEYHKFFTSTSTTFLFS